MAQARIGSSQLLALVLGAVALGATLGFTFAPRGAEANAADRTAAVALDATESAAPRARALDSMQLERDESTRAEAVAEKPSSAHVSDARLTEAKAKLNVPSPAPEQGAGSISGMVLDQHRAPLEGVTLIATRYGYSQIATVTSASIGTGPPAQKSLDEALESAATSWANSRANRRVTTTSADGSYAFADLPDSRFSIRAYKEDWTIKGDSNTIVMPGTTLNLTGTAVRSLTLDVRLPGGSAAESAIIECKVDKDTLRFDWSPAEPTIRIGAERFPLTALGDAIQQRESNYEVASRLKSETHLINMDELGASPLTIQLAGRPGIHGTVTQEWPSAKGMGVSAVAIADQASFDPDDLPDSTITVRLRSGEFVLLDLEPGLYAVGVTPNAWGNATRIRQVQFVELGSEVVEVHLDVPAPSLADHVKVHCLDPLGRPISGIEFDRRAMSDGGGTSGGTNATQGPDGAYWFPDEVLAEWNLNSWPESASISLTAKTSSYGNRILELEGGVREYTLSFEEPHSLTVDISGYADRDPDRKLIVRIVNPSSDDSWGNTILTSFVGRGWEEGPRISNEGRVVFPTIAQGAWRVELTEGDSWNDRVFDSKDIKVTGRDLSVSLNMPQLFVLSVLAPKLKPGTPLWLNHLEKGDSTWTSSGQDSLDEAHRVTFKGLAPGTYRLQANGASKPMEVTVPSGEVLFDPKLPNVLTVQIQNETGSLYLAGFRAGDKVIAVEGIPIDELGPANNFYKKLTKSAVEMTVKRGTETLSLTLGQVPEGAGAFVELGGMLSLAYE